MCEKCFILCKYRLQINGTYSTDNESDDWFEFLAASTMKYSYQQRTNETLYFHEYQCKFSLPQPFPSFQARSHQFCTRSTHLHLYRHYFATFRAVELSIFFSFLMKYCYIEILAISNQCNKNLLITWKRHETVFSTALVRSSL